MMVGVETFHIIFTEVVIGNFTLSAIAFAAILLFKADAKKVRIFDVLAHGGLALGIVMIPFAIFTGIQAGPGTGMESPILVNKFLFSMAALGLAIGVLFIRYKQGGGILETNQSMFIQSGAGMMACSLVLLTGSMGGTFSRGESVLDFLNLPYETAMLIPLWLSILLLLAGIGNLFVGLKKMKSTV